MREFEKYPATRPLPDRELVVKLDLNGEIVSGKSFDSNASGIRIKTAKKEYDSNNTVYWKYVK